MKKRLTPDGQSEIDDALQRVVDSAEFSNATRLKEFLSYVVDEYCAGRGDLILGKTIAQDVYSRGADAIEKGASLVKVDAGRLRRRLSEYYAGSGAGDPIHIEIRRGGYTPSFEYVATSKNTDPVPPGNWAQLLLIGPLTILIIIGLLSWRWDAPETPDASSADARTIAERQAYLANSPATLQAVNLASQARAMIFPPLDPKRLQATLDMFERSIELDPSYYGGYAGAAQTLAMQAVFSPDRDARSLLVTNAIQRSDQAIALRPDASWSLSALALVKFADRDFDGANATSKLAIAVNPSDFEALDFDGVIALFSGDFERALQSADPSRHIGRKGTRFIFRNTFAAASYHLGHPEDTISYLTSAAEQGDPISQISVVYLSAANYRTGNYLEAQKLVNDFQESWPNARIDLVFGQIFSDPVYVAEVIEPFKLSGWSFD